MYKQSNVALSTKVPTRSFKLPVHIGIVAGLFGSLAIIAIIAVLTRVANMDIWFSPRTIASVLFRESAAAGLAPIIVGTLIHFASGAAYGALFARLSPRLPAAFWIVAGLIFGVGIWVVAILALPLAIVPVGVDPREYFDVLLISHLLYGLVLGIAGTLYGLRLADQS
jgi:hypothetical protein